MDGTIADVVEGSNTRATWLRGEVGVAMVELVVGLTERI